MTEKSDDALIDLRILHARCRLALLPVRIDFVHLTKHWQVKELQTAFAFLMIRGHFLQLLSSVIRSVKMDYFTFNRTCPFIVVNFSPHHALADKGLLHMPNDKVNTVIFRLNF